MTQKLLFLVLPLFIFVFVSSVNAKTSTDSAASKLKMQREDLQTQKKAAISQIKETVAAKREAAKEAIKTKREEFKTKLNTIRDGKKKVLVERIDAKLANANAKHTDRFAQVLSNLQAILDKISTDVDKTNAQAAIDAANTAVEAQAAKTYTITISTETALRSDVGAVTSQLRLDLSATHKLVIDAKQAVQALRKDNNAIMKKEASDSASL